MHNTPAPKPPIRIILFLYLIIPLFFIIYSSCLASTKEAHCILEKEKEEISVAEDGTFIDFDEVFLTILDEKGKRQQQVQNFFINRNYSNLEIINMELIHEDGTSTPIDWKSNSKETNPAQTTKMNIYDPNQKVIKVFLPDLKVGDTIHYKIRLNNFKPIIKGHFFGNVLLQHPFPVKEIELKITIPSSKNLYSLIKDNNDKSNISIDQSSGREFRTYTWCFKNIPEIVPEPSMPDPSRLAMRLLFSTMKSWKEVSTWYYKLSEPRLVPTEAIKKKVAQLIRDKKSPRDKARALFMFVSRKIRYMGLIEEAKRPGFEPHQVGLTFERRYGVCRDKAALLVSMLRLAGFKAAPVLIKAGGKLDKEIPIPYFNHAICAILGDDGRPKTYMDPTSETSNQFLPDYEQDSSCLPATKEGSDLLLTPVSPPSRNMFVMLIDDKIDHQGNISGTIEIKASNFIDTAFRGILMARTKDQQRRFLKRFLLKRRPHMVIKTISWTDPSDTTTPFSISYSFNIPKGIQNGYLYPISLAKELGLIDNWIISKASMIERHYPLKLNYAIKTIIKEKIHLPQSKKTLLLPHLRNISSPYFKLDSSFAISQGTLQIKRIFLNRALEIPTKAYKALLEIQSELLKDEFLPIMIGEGDR